MVLGTNTDVEQIRNVQDETGEIQSPANERRQKNIQQALENEPGLTAIQYTTSGTTAEQLPSHLVPDGIEVLVTYLTSNSSDVYVGDSDTQQVPLVQSGDSLALNVQDTSSIYIRTPTAGDGVAILFEGGE